MKKTLKSIDDSGDHPLVEYVKKRWIRACASVAVLVVEFFWLFTYVRGDDWKQKSAPSKLFFAMKMTLAMAVFEAIRWVDAVITVYSSDTQQTDTKAKPASSPVDNDYIKRNRGYK